MHEENVTCKMQKKIKKNKWLHTIQNYEVCCVHGHHILRKLFEFDINVEQTF